MKFFNPPRILIDPGSLKGVILGGSTNMLSIDLDRNIHVLKDLVCSYTLATYESDEMIDDQISGWEILEMDEDALVDPEIMVTKICNAFEDIMRNKQIFFGISSFEGNAFNADVYRTFDLSRDDINKLITKHRASLQRGFPKVQKGNYIQSTFIGEMRDLFEYKKITNFTGLMLKVTQLHGQVVGIVSTSQDAANFFILTTILKEKEEEREIVDQKNLETIKMAMENNQITPISWYKIDLGFNSFKSLDNWEEFASNPRFKAMVAKYKNYLLDQKKLDVNPEHLEEGDLFNLTPDAKKKIVSDIKNCVEELQNWAKDD